MVDCVLIGIDLEPLYDKTIPQFPICCYKLKTGAALPTNQHNIKVDMCDTMIYLYKTK